MTDSKLYIKNKNVFYIKDVWCESTIRKMEIHQTLIIHIKLSNKYIPVISNSYQIIYSVKQYYYSNV